MEEPLIDYSKNIVMTFGHCVVAFEQKHDEVEENNN
jgi:hypothetical protein